MEETMALIKKGIILEDEFIEMYLEILASEEYLSSFPQARSEQVLGILNTLITESRYHKSTLEQIELKQ